ncbi:MAG: hypothetical protein RIF41_21010, partial [Polyangiaceae bacterium]
MPTAERTGRRALALLATITFLVAAPPPTLEACGPIFPNQLLLDARGAALSAPAADFGRELARIAERHGLASTHPLAYVASGFEPEATTATVEALEIKALLEHEGHHEGAVQQVLADVAAMRRALKDAPTTATVPRDLPEELRRYLEGAIAFHRGDVALARGHWERLLELAPPERRLRSVWAAFMLGKSWLGHDDGMAVLWLSRARELAAEGYEDRLGLALTSYGWEARALGRLGRDRDMVARYVTQASLGDPTAVSSIRQVMAGVRGRNPDAVFTDSLLRDVQTASILATGYIGHVVDRPDKQVGEWLTGLERHGVRKVAGADRIAWLAYRYGDAAAAQRWLARSDPKSAITRWVAAKLALRAGDLQRAARLYKQVVVAFPEDERWSLPPDADGLGPDHAASSPAARARAELGLIQLSRGAFADAADALVRGGYWIDGAYVAEQVLTLGELKKLVDERWSDPGHVADESALPPPEQARRGHARQLRSLLARRLVRAGRHADAKAYFPSTLRVPLDQIAAASAQSLDPALDPTDRARAHWTLARLTRTHGMDLMGTEGGPDWHVWGGSYELSDTAVHRFSPKAPTLLGATPLERRRVGKHRPTPDARYHYRHVAAESAWRAATLMP